MTRWAFLDPDTGEWIEVKSEVVIFESRAALTESIAEALMYDSPDALSVEASAAAIVARMLGARTDD